MPDSEANAVDGNLLVVQEKLVVDKVSEVDEGVQEELKSKEYDDSLLLFESVGLLHFRLFEGEGKFVHDIFYFGVAYFFVGMQEKVN